MPPLTYAKGGASPPTSSVTKPLTSPTAIGAQTSGLINTDTGVSKWKRAMTSGMVTSQIVRLISTKFPR